LVFKVVLHNLIKHSPSWFPFGF